MNFIKRDLQYFILMEIYFQINLWLMEHLTPPCGYHHPNRDPTRCGWIKESIKGK